MKKSSIGTANRFTTFCFFKQRENTQISYFNIVLDNDLSSLSSCLSTVLSIVSSKDTTLEKNKFIHNF